MALLYLALFPFIVRSQDTIIDSLKKKLEKKYRKAEAAVTTVAIAASIEVIEEYPEAYLKLPKGLRAQLVEQHPNRMIKVFRENPKLIKAIPTRHLTARAFSRIYKELSKELD